ncbi:hypothetical protein, partial [Zoogloea sp. LCSB751]
MTYYRNNITHMLMLPSLMAAIITQHRRISRQELLRHIQAIYPMLKAELFLRWSNDELAAELDKMSAEMRRQGLITIHDDELHI